MDKKAITQEVVRVLRDKVGILGDVAGDARLEDDLHLDSLQLMTFVVEIENCFAVDIEEGAEETIRTVNEVVDYMFERLRQREPNRP